MSGASLPHGSADRNANSDRTIGGGSGRSLTGARIETSSRATRLRLSASLPHGSADRNQHPISHFQHRQSRSLTGARIETF